jgi:hypothetical protein
MKLLPGPGTGFRLSPGGNPHYPDALASFLVGQISKAAGQYGNFMVMFHEFAAYMRAGISGAAPHRRELAVDD